MSPNVKVGNLVKCRITGVQPYGAFVIVDEETNGLIHISEITNGFVKDINDYVKVDDELIVKVLGIDDNTGNLSLSLKSIENEQVRTEKKKRKKSNEDYFIEQIKNEDGFKILKLKLKEWIDQVKFDRV